MKIARVSWHKRNHSDELFAMTVLSLEERGALITITDLIYDRGEPLGDDDRSIAHQLFTDIRVWRRIKARLLKLGRLTVEGGLLRTPETEAWLAARKQDQTLQAPSSLPPDWAVLRTRIIERDGERCAYCGATDGPFEVDHVIPRVRGGGNDPDNLTVACRTCNRSKKDSLLDEWTGRFRT